MTTSSGTESAFALQDDVRLAWRRYLDALVPLRPALHRYCCRLTGSVWDGEDLMQDTFLKVFGLLGKIDADLRDPRAYLFRSATNLWIDQQRRRALDMEYRASVDTAEAGADGSSRGKELFDSANDFLTTLPARERAAVLLRDVLDLAADEAAALLGVSVGAVKAALHRGRERLGAGPAHDPTKARNFASPQLVQRFLDALAANDLDALRAICSADVQIELVGGAQMENFESARTFFAHAHFVFPEHMQAAARAMGFGSNPSWQLFEYEGELLVVGFRELDGDPVLNEAHRFEEAEGRIVRVRSYCFTPETLGVIAEAVGAGVAPKPHRSPDPPRAAK
jgi:RNA polymerase sigma-70 factor (ECF subfamily)